MSSIIDRKFYSENDELLCTLKYLEFSKAEIHFNVNLKITKQLEPFKMIFINQTITPLTQKAEQLEVKYEFHEDSDIIEKIEIINLDSIENYNILTSSILKLLNKLTETVITSKIERRFYTKNDELLCIVNYLDFNRVIINFINPDKLNITNESEKYMEIFLNETVDKLKEENPSIDVTYDFYNETEIIESIEFLNIESIDIYNFITSKVMELLANYS
ncbi:MAG: hypothetical protein EU547_04845 [Promethearchaeota archaeon]|nr:MAG: hypothetical protein EU547_04845 [Candidatus Lokiarchaeota archaeon]